MNSLLKSAALAAAFALAGVPAAAQQKPYEPHVGQAGKDVIWVPTPDEVVERMLRMAQVTKDDYVVDLGAGDGKIAIMAAKKFGARSMGIEYNPEMARYAQGNVVKAGVTERARILNGDIFATDFTSATVVTMYLLPGLNMKLRPQLLQMKPGTRIVSHSFTMEDWQPDETSSMDGRRAYFWVIPASVMGTWSLEMGAAAPSAPPAEAISRADCPQPAQAPVHPPVNYQVRKGDTLGAIARKHSRPGVELDDLVDKIFRANPDAFIHDDVNLVRSGRVLTIPGDDAPAATAAGPASNPACGSPTAATRAEVATFSGATQKLDLSLEQRFQKIEGSVAFGTTQAGLRDATLRGPAIAFSFVDQSSVRRDFTGRVSGGKMEGAFRADNGTEGRWTATKK